MKKRYWVILAILSLGLAMFFLPVNGKVRQSGYVSNPKFTGDIKFPEGFLWGTATADWQIEHAQDSDWTSFLKDAKKNRRHKRSDLGHPAPKNIAAIENYSLENLLKTADFDRQFENDFVLAKEAKTNAFRFSFSWARLFPRANMKTADPAGIAFYKKVIAAMKKNGIRPSATLLHFTSPNWLWQEVNGKRGLERADFVEHFAQFTREVARHFIDDIEVWCTLNEPVVQAFFGYMAGIFPPFENRTKIEELEPVLTALLKAHAAAYKILHEEALKKSRKVQVGIAEHTRDFQPLRNYFLLDRITAKMVEQNFVWDFLDAIHSGVLRLSNSKVAVAIEGLRDSQDYVGINYYGRFYVEGKLLAPTQFELHTYDKNSKNEKINDVQWAMYPAGLMNILRQAHRRYGKPIYILENGTADKQKSDRNRQELLITHLRELGLAISEGIDIKGYFYWALTDNFEWVEGLGPRFGLYHVDYNNQFKRSKRDSVEVYKTIIEKGISREDWQKAIKNYQIRL